MFELPPGEVLAFQERTTPCDDGRESPWDDISGVQLGASLAARRVCSVPVSACELDDWVLVLDVDLSWPASKAVRRQVPAITKTNAPSKFSGPLIDCKKRFICDSHVLGVTTATRSQVVRTFSLER